MKQKGLYNTQAHRDAATHRRHQRVANKIYREEGIPRAETRRRLRHEEKDAEAQKAERLAELQRPPGDPVSFTKSMNPRVHGVLRGMTFTARFAAGEKYLKDTLRFFGINSIFDSYDPDSWEDWLVATKRSLHNQRRRYRALSTHNKAQFRAHVLLEISMMAVRDGSAARMANWLHTPAKREADRLAYEESPQGIRDAELAAERRAG